jgi:hypothetical protein
MLLSLELMVSKKPKPSGQQKKSEKNKSGDKLDSDLTAEEMTEAEENDLQQYERTEVFDFSNQVEETITILVLLGGIQHVIFLWIIFKHAQKQIQD